MAYLHREFWPDAEALYGFRDVAGHGFVFCPDGLGRTRARQIKSQSPLG